MIYFTDAILIPGEGSGTQFKELSQALNGTGMIRCAQVENEAELVFDWDTANAENEAYFKSPVDERVGTPYLDEFAKKLNGLLQQRSGDLEYDTGGAWGGPGGSSEAWGITKHEPEVSYVSGTTGGEVRVRVTGANPDMDAAVDWMHDITDELNGDGHRVTAEKLGDTDILRVYWDVDESWEPEGPDYEPDDDYDDYDDPRSDYIYDPY